jgi:hypothetical protein
MRDSLYPPVGPSRMASAVGMAVVGTLPSAVAVL